MNESEILNLVDRESIRIRFTEQMKKRLFQEKERTGKSVSQIVRQSVSEEQENILIKEKYKQQRNVLISNTVRIMGFVLLAIVFEHWWIVLFSALFLTFIEK